MEDIIKTDQNEEDALKDHTLDNTSDHDQVCVHHFILQFFLPNRDSTNGRRSTTYCNTLVIFLFLLIYMILSM